MLWLDQDINFIFKKCHAVLKIPPLTKLVRDLTPLWQKFSPERLQILSYKWTSGTSCLQFLRLNLGSEYSKGPLSLYSFLSSLPPPNTPLRTIIWEFRSCFWLLINSKRQTKLKKKKCWQECKLLQLLPKTVCDICILHDPALPFIGIWRKERHVCID